MLRLRVARALETGALGGPASRAVSAAWARFADPVRPVALPPGLRVVGIGGATLGGSGKTPVVLELARAMARHRRVAVVATAYRARVRRACVVRVDDAAAWVGDEALWLARALDPVPVIVGRDRGEALALAAGLVEVAIVDGLLQTRPERLGCALLVLDGEMPWGAARCPPAGDLRATPARVLAAADVVLAHGPFAADARIPAFPLDARLVGVIGSDGEPITLDVLRSLRVGVVLAIARPERVLRSLAAHGIVPQVVELHPDHARIPEPGPAAVEAWLTTPKCATKLACRRGGAPVWVLDHRVELPAEVVALASGGAS